jgi:hypothetical protein
MRPEREKMLAGDLYDPLDSELVAARERARDLGRNRDIHDRYRLGRSVPRAPDSKIDRLVEASYLFRALIAHPPMNN